MWEVQVFWEGHKIDKIFTVNLTVCSTFKLTVKILSIFVAFLENMNFKVNAYEMIVKLLSSNSYPKMQSLLLKGTPATKCLFGTINFFSFHTCLQNFDYLHFLLKVR